MGCVMSDLTDKKKRAAAVQAEMDRCVHYRRPQTTCGAGHSYDEVAKTKELGSAGCFLRLPCLRSHHDPESRRQQPLCACADLEWTSREEAEKFVDKLEAAWANLEKGMKVMAQVKAAHKGRNWQGTMECPVCADQLFVTHVAYNGHTSGRCTTPGCLNWIE